MGMFCKLFDHKQEAINFWGDEAEYILFKCKRCGEEEIFCSYEGKFLPNDKMGKEILDKMINDKEFSKACHIHAQFLKAENDNPFNFNKQEREFERIRGEFRLNSNIRPACPVEMYKKGLWIDKNKTSQSPDVKAKTPKTKVKGENKSKEIKGEKSTRYGKFKGNADASYGESLEQLEQLEKIYAKDENYEKAAEIHKKILKLKNKNK